MNQPDGLEPPDVFSCSAFLFVAAITNSSEHSDNYRMEVNPFAPLIYSGILLVSLDLFPTAWLHVCRRKTETRLIPREKPE